MDRSCQDCVHYKFYLTGSVSDICMGVWSKDNALLKEYEKLTDLSKAKDCQFYNDDDWVKQECALFAQKTCFNESIV